MKHLAFVVIVLLVFMVSCAPTATSQPQMALATATVQIPTETPTSTNTPIHTPTLPLTPTPSRAPTITRTSTSTPMPPLPALYVDGPYIKRSDTGQSVWLKGVNIDASHNPIPLELAKAWNVNVIRLMMTIDPQSYSVQSIIGRIEQAIDFGNKNGIYIILDPHPDIPGINPPELPNDQVVELMGSLADRFKDRTNVIYGLYNEPHPDSLGDAKKQWEAWMDRGTKVAQAIRAKNPKSVLVVPGGRLWSRDFSYYRDHPFPFDNVIFDVHDYTSNYPEYKREMWTWMIGKYPVFMGEWGDPNKGGWNTDADVAYSREAIAIVNSNPFLVHYAAFNLCRGSLNVPCLIRSSTSDPSPRGKVVFDDLRNTPQSTPVPQVVTVPVPYTVPVPMTVVVPVPMTVVVPVPMTVVVPVPSLNAYYSLQSYNYSNYFIRHRDFLGEITTISSTLDREDATFRITPGLASGSCVSFESLNHPSYYLRHQEFRIKLHTSDGTQLFREDATFCQRPGLDDSAWASFESYNYRGYYLRHLDFHLYIERGSGDLYRADTTFRIVAPLGR